MILNLTHWTVRYSTKNCVPRFRWLKLLAFSFQPQRGDPVIRSSKWAIDVLSTLHIALIWLKFSDWRRYVFENASCSQLIWFCAGIRTGLLKCDHDIQIPWHSPGKARRNAYFWAWQEIWCRGTKGWKNSTFIGFEAYLQRRFVFDRRSIIQAMTAGIQFRRMSLPTIGWAFNFFPPTHYHASDFICWPCCPFITFAITYPSWSYSTDECLKSAVLLPDVLADQEWSHSYAPNHTAFNKLTRFPKSVFHYLEKPEAAMIRERFAIGMLASGSVSEAYAVITGTSIYWDLEWTNSFYFIV